MKATSLIKSGSEYKFIDRKTFTELHEGIKEIWIHVEVEDREELNQLRGKKEIRDDLIDILLNPGKSFRLQRLGNLRILDCNINYDRDELVPEYLTFLFYQETLITVTTKESLVSPEISPSQLIDTTRDYNGNMIALLIFGRMLDRNAIHAKQLSKKVDNMLKISIARDFNMAMEDLQELYSEVIDFNELFEDQLTTLRLIPIEMNDNSAIQGIMNRTEQSMAHLVNTTSRTIDKLDYIFQRHRSTLQERGNARLNTLTVVQAIFVPLTFIAGIYGMNFVNIPELEWPSGYLYVWILMITIAFTSLFLFYKSGWFKSD